MRPRPPDGPVKQFELKDLLSQQAEWSEHSRAIGDAVAGGEMPLPAEGLASTIEMLKRIQPELAPLLGRSVAAARQHTRNISFS